MEKCRCKVVLHRVESSVYQGKQAGGSHLHFRAEYDETLPEDQRFATATPTAEFVLNVDNPDAIEFLQRGKAAFYVDFIPVPDPGYATHGDDDGAAD